jgi:hypothetical protein
MSLFLAILGGYFLLSVIGTIFTLILIRGGKGPPRDRRPDRPPPQKPRVGGALSAYHELG